MPLRLLHLSDIHFRGYAAEWDDDADQRQQVVEEVARLVARDGKIDGILIGGDVAYSGRHDEFENAKTWIADLVSRCGCPSQNVWVVPGNHDIDRSIVERSPILREFRSSVRSCETGMVGAALKARMVDDPASEHLLCALQAYNSFALPLGCAVSAHKFFWKDETLEVDGHRLLLWGMNSALLSDKADQPTDEDVGTTANLVLGPSQTRVDLRQDEIRVVMVHHPPNWLRDWHLVADYVSRAHVVLFGHEHAFEPEQLETDSTVHVRAGAVGPERGDDWVPTFNVLTLAVDAGVLRVDVDPRIWDPRQTTFVANQSERVSYSLPVNAPARARKPEPLNESDGGTAAEANPLNPADSKNCGATLSANEGSSGRRRSLVYRYLSLPETRRERIARELGVFDESDSALPENEFYEQTLTRIRDQRLIDALEKKLDV